MKANKKIIILAVITGLITIFALNNYLSDLYTESPTIVSPELASVVVAKMTIPQHSRITNDMLMTKNIPSDAVHPEALKSISEAAGGISRAEIVKGEQILGSRVATYDRRAGLSYRIPENLRGVSIPIIDEVAGVSGYISPGDKVDVLVTLEDPDNFNGLTVYTVVQNALVLAAGEFTQQQDNEERRLVSTVTLGVTPAEAEVLAFANIRGSFHLSLRSPLDEEIVELDYFSFENFDFFGER